MSEKIVLSQLVLIVAASMVLGSTAVMAGEKKLEKLAWGLMVASALGVVICGFIFIWR